MEKKKRGVLMVEISERPLWDLGRRLEGEGNNDKGSPVSLHKGREVDLKTRNGSYGVL